VTSNNARPVAPDAAVSRSGEAMLRRNWAGWYPDGDDLIFEQTGYDLRVSALGGLVGLAASLAVLIGLLVLGLPGEPVRNGIYGALLLVAIIALVACAIVARQALRPVHRVARFSRDQQSLVVRDVLALGIKREHRYPYAQLGQAYTRNERVLTIPANPAPGQARHYLLAYPVMHIALERPGQIGLTLTTGALLSPHAAQRGAQTINEHLDLARVSAPVPSHSAATPAARTPAAEPVSPVASSAKRLPKRAIPPRPIRPGDQ